MALHSIKLSHRRTSGSIHGEGARAQPGAAALGNGRRSSGMKTGWVPTGLVTLTVVALCGCGTVSTRTKGDSGPYCGFSHDMEKVSRAEEWLTWSGEGSAGAVRFPWPRGLLWIVDVPLSLTGDTIMLPVDCLRSKRAQANVQSEAGQDRATNGSQRSGSEMGSAPTAAGSRRSP